MKMTRRQSPLWIAAPLLLFVAAVAIISNVDAVDRSKFHNCDQVEFCKRQRDLTRTATFSIDPKSFKAPANVRQISADVVKQAPHQPDIPFRLEMTAYKGGILRMRLAEKDTPKARYEVKDVIEKSLQEDSLTYDNKKSFVFGEGGRNKVSIATNPMQIELYDNDELVMAVNQRNLIKYETLHARAAPPQPEQPNPPENADNPDAVPAPEPVVDDGEKTGESIGMDITFVGAAQVYGIPEHAIDMNLKSTRKSPEENNDILRNPYRLFNLDVFEYELDETMALYGAVPLMIGHSTKGNTVGMFWLNGAETWIDVADVSGSAGKHTHWMSESGVIDVFFLMGPTPTDIFRQYASMTGTTPLPPLFSIAYHQCRWNYKDEEDVKTVDAAFDEHNIPYDVLWLDIEHTDGKRYFTWDNNKFGTPTAMLDNVSSKGRKMVTIVDPHIKKDSGYYIYNEAQSQGHLIKDGGNSANDYDGFCWPGSSAYPDFTAPEVRAWWAKQFAYDKYKGSTKDLFIWNDMNEPSVFNGPEVTMHKEAIHKGGWTHRDLHNLYGMYYHRATFEGLMQRNPGETARPFVLSRAFYAGSQKYGAIWTGDNAAQWSHLNVATPMLMSLGLAGITFSGADVGGFFGNPDANLLTRWYQAGAFYPFFRAHAHLDTKRREPWLFGEPYTTIIRNAIRTRYTLLPYFYTQFYNHSVTGAPVLRPLWVEFPSDEKTFAMNDQFMVGKALLVKPITDANVESLPVYLPSSELWYDYFTHRTYGGPPYHTFKTPLEKTLVFQRGGTILPRKDRPRRSSTQMKADPYTLVVALNKESCAEGELYIDDGATHAYRSGAFVKRVFSFIGDTLMNKPNSHTSASVIAEVAPNTVERVLVLGVPKQPSRVVLKTLQADNSIKETSLQFDYAKEPIGRLTIRNPGVGIAEDWAITIGL